MDQVSLMVRQAKLVPTPRQVAEVAGVAKAALVAALETLSQDLGFAEVQTLVAALQQHQPAVWVDFYYSLAWQIAEQLGRLDEGVKAAYIDEYDLAPEDLSFGEAARTTVIHLIVWVRRKTEALHSLAAALDHALVECYLEQIGQPHLTHLLEVHLFDDADVQNRIGYGAFFYAVSYCPPTEIWRRPGQELSPD